MRSPRLDDRWIDALTNKAQVTKRANEAIATDPARFEGHAVPSAIDVISNLKTYIGNVMKGEDRTIPKHNKKWMLCFGESCTDLFTVLRFTQTVSDLFS